MINNIVIRLLVCVIMVSFLHSIAYSQVISNNEALKEEDNIKAKIWSSALLWIYEDNNKQKPTEGKEPIPSVKNNSVEEFRASIAADKDPYKFKEKIFDPIYNQKRGLDINSLIVAIVQEASKRESRKPRINELESLLREVEEERRVINKIDENKVRNKSLLVPVDTKENVKDVYSTKILNTQLPYWMQVVSLVLALISCLIISFVAFKLFFEKDEKTSSKKERVNNSKEEMTSFLLREEFVKKVGEIESLVSKINRKVDEQKGAFNNEMQNLLLKNDTNADSQGSHFPSDAKPKIINITKRYTPIPEGVFVKDKDIEEVPSRSSYLEMTFNHQDQDKVSFRFNPNSPQELAINNSQERLRAFFDIKQETSVVKRIVNLSDGQLVKTNQGWRIERKAAIRFE